MEGRGWAEILEWLESVEGVRIKREKGEKGNIITDYPRLVRQSQKECTVLQRNLHELCNFKNILYQIY